jgi:valyl-tRNA synthetase
MSTRFDKSQIDAEFLAQSALHNLSDADYTTILPPPNLTGALHIGHALVFTLQDAILRYHRAKDKSVSWFAGTDHAGIAGQLMFTKFLDSKGLHPKSDLEQRAYMDKWRQEKQEIIEDQCRKMLLGMDWGKARFTLSAQFSKWVTRTFVDLHKAGYIFRGTRLVHWDPVLKTALSDLEVDLVDTKGCMHYIRYPGVDCEGITVATTRPETMFGDTAVAVHPDDERYKSLVGKTVRVPLIDREVRIVADARCKTDKGTGAVKITPAHDFLDHEIGKDHNLPVVQVIDQKCRMIVGQFTGMERMEARKATVQALQELGLVERIEEITSAIPHGNRGGAQLETIPTTQWFCDMRELADKALEQIGQIEIYPESQRKVLVSWLENIEPWCLSRQLWWGHRIPVWYDTEHHKPFVALDHQEALEMAHKHYGKPVELYEDKDVLDTWFSSALWSFATDSPHNNPVVHNILVTGRDILNMWVARMIMLSVFHNGKIPFKQVLLTGLIRDRKGRKMSKTLGNVIDPLDIVEKWGADALRLWLIKEVLPDKADIPVSEKDVETQSRFLTKLWNCTRYCTTNKIESKISSAIHPWNTYWLDCLKKIEVQVEQCWKDYHFAHLYQTLRHAIWEQFANCYLEGAKVIWDAETSCVANYSLRKLLQMLSPLAPAITHKLLHQFDTHEIHCDNTDQSAQSWINTAAQIRRFSKLTSITSMSLDTDTDCIEILSAISKCKVTKYQNIGAKALKLELGTLYIDQALLSQAETGIRRKLTEVAQEIQSRLSAQKAHTDRTPHAEVEKLSARLDELNTEEKELVSWIEEQDSHR